MSDLIERTAVLDLMRTNWADNDGDTAMQLSIDDVRNLPAVYPETKTETRWNKLFMWLFDMMFGIFPDETTPEDEREKREVQVELLSDIMEWMEGAENE